MTAQDKPHKDIRRVTIEFSDGSTVVLDAEEFGTFLQNLGTTVSTAVGYEVQKAVSGAFKFGKKWLDAQMKKGDKGISK